MNEVFNVSIPPDVLDWVRQFAGETIRIHITKDGLVTLWTKCPNEEMERRARAEALQSVFDAIHKDWQSTPNDPPIWGQNLIGNGMNRAMQVVAALQKTGGA